MAAPTEAEIRLMAGDVFHMLELVRRLGATDTTNMLGLDEDVVAGAKGDFAGAIIGGWRRMRNALSSVMSPQVGRAALAPVFRAYGRFIDSPFTDVDSILRRDLYDWFIDNAQQVEKRGFTFDITPTAGGANVGNGTVHRVNVDANGFDIDTQTADTKVLRCINDEHSGAQEHQERFEIRGEDRTIDYLALRGTTAQPGTVPIGSLRALSSQDASTFIRNPSFHSHSIAGAASGGLWTPAAVDEISSWTLDAVTNVKLDENITYKDSFPNVTQRSVRFNGNAYIQQNLNVNQAQFPAGIVGLGQDIAPIYVEVAVYRESTATGTLTLTFGGSSVAVDVTTLTDDAWNVVKLPLGTANYFPNFNTEDPLVKIALTGYTTGAVLLDEMVIAPFQFFDNGWYAIVGGATPFLRDDTLTLTDTATDTCVIQIWLARLFGTYLPGAAAASEEWSDPL